MKRILWSLALALACSGAAFAVLNTSTSSISYSGPVDAGVPQSIPFLFQHAADLVVTETTGATVTTLTYGSGYTLTGINAQAGGTISLAAGISGGTTLQIRRLVVNTQPTSFRTQSSYQPSVHENALDWLEMQIQQLASGIDGGVVTGPAGPPGPTGSSSFVILPVADGGTGTATGAITATTGTGAVNYSALSGAFETTSGAGTFMCSSNAFSHQITVTAGSTNEQGINATGHGTGAGGSFSGGVSGAAGAIGVGTGTHPGVYASCGGTNCDGLDAYGDGSGAGVAGVGGATGPGGSFTGGATGAAGVLASGTGGYPAVWGIAAGGSYGNGVEGDGNLSGAGVVGNGGASAGPGGNFMAGSGGIGVTASGSAGGAGVYGVGGTTGPGGSFSGGASAYVALVATAAGSHGSGLTATGSGVGVGAVVTGGATGDGLDVIATGSFGIVVDTHNPDGGTPADPAIWITPTAPPSAGSTSAGALYFDTTLKGLRYSDGTAFIRMPKMTQVAFSSSTTATFTVESGSIGCICGETASAHLAYTDSCAISSTTATVTASTSNSDTWTCTYY